MKKVVQIFPEEIPLSWINGWRKYADKVIILNDPRDANPDVPFVFGGNLMSKWVRNWMADGKPCFVTNRPFLGSQLNKKRTAWRVSVNSFACTKLNSIPHSRWHTIGLNYQPWKVKEIKNILIGPPRKSIIAWLGITAEEWAENLKNKFPGTNVKIRLKEGMKGKGGRYKTLWNDFDWADLVISYSSAITAEAFWYGKKVISLGVCPTWVAADNHLDNWSCPNEPINRKIWHEHMAWIQFTNEEWESGAAQEMTVTYQGWPTQVTAVDNPYLLNLNTDV